jgi:uncharacterized protein YkwD
MRKFWYLFLILIVAVTIVLSWNSVVNYFSPKIRDVEKAAINAVVSEIKKDVSTPPPLVAPKKTSLPSASAAQLTISGTIKWTDIERKNNGNLLPLSENTTLDEIARLRLEDMFKYQYFAHISPTGSGAETVAKEVGYDYLAIGENLALGNFKNDEDLVNAWMASPGHRANILNSHYQEIGVAVRKGIFEGESTWIAVQIFGKPASACPQVDAALKSEITSLESQLQGLEVTINNLRADIASTPPRGDQYNAKVGEYNTLVAQYNGVLEQTKAMVSQYNSQVAALNQCISQ